MIPYLILTMVDKACFAVHQLPTGLPHCKEVSYHVINLILNLQVAMVCHIFDIQYSSRKNHGMFLGWVYHIMFATYN